MIRTVPLVRTWGSAKHDLLDGQGKVCQVPLTQVAVWPCMQAVSPSAKFHNKHYGGGGYRAEGSNVPLQVSLSCKL